MTQASGPDPMPESSALPDDFIHHNPWTHLWLHPRRTIRQQSRIEGDVAVYWIPALTACIYTLPLGASVMSWPGVLISMSGLLLGPLMLRFQAWLLRICGGWLGGKAESFELRSALAWAQAPILTAVAASFVFILLQSQPWFRAMMPVFGIVMMFAPFLIFILTAIYTVAGVSEVHKFGIGKSILSLLMMGFVTTLVSWAVIALVMGIMIPVIIHKAQQQNQMDFSAAPYVQLAEEEAPGEIGKDGIAVGEEWIANLDLVSSYAAVTGNAYPVEAHLLTEADREKISKVLAENAAADELQDPESWREALKQAEAQKEVADVVEVEQPKRAGYDISILFQYTGPVTVTLTDGSKVSGNFLGVEGSDLMVETEQSGLQIFAAARVRDVERHA